MRLVRDTTKKAAYTITIKEMSKSKIGSYQIYLYHMEAGFNLQILNTCIEYVHKYGEFTLIERSGNVITINLPMLIGGY